jgi:hypothetical protein
MDEFLELLEMMQDELQDWKSIPDASDHHEHYLIAPSPPGGSSPHPSSSAEEEESDDDHQELLQPAITTTSASNGCPWLALPRTKKRKRVAEHRPADDLLGSCTTPHNTKSEEERRATKKQTRPAHDQEEEVAGQRQSVPASTI